MAMQSNHDNVDISSAVRRYVAALMAGDTSVQRPKVSWKVFDALDTLERSVTVSDGQTQALEDVLARLRRQCPELDALLQESQPATAPEAPPSPEPAPSSVEIAPDEGIPPLPQSAYIPPEAAEYACLWLNAYESFSRQASPEGYEDFHVFCGLWLLSVVAARRVSLKLLTKRIYTNLMIVLCADTSMYAKSTTAHVAKSVLHAAGLSTLLAPDRITPQKLLSLMSGTTAPADYDDQSAEMREVYRSKVAMSGQRGMYYDEFGKFVQGMLRKGSTTSDFADLLLTFDNCQETYENATLARGGEAITQPYLALLGSMTPANVKVTAKQGADFWTDGFWARFSFVTAPANSFIDAPFEHTELDISPRLLLPIQRWHDRLGVPYCEITPILDKHHNHTGRYRIEREPLPQHSCSIEPDAYQAWTRYRSALKQLASEFRHKDLHGSYARLPETAMRIAVLFASLENADNINLRLWARAQQLAEKLRKNLHELYAQVNVAEDLSQTAQLENAIIERMRKLADKGMTLLTVPMLKVYLKKYSLEEIQQRLDSLVKAGVLGKDFSDRSPAGKYRLIDA